jgi:very-short-patch-repair endonuclease
VPLPPELLIFARKLRRQQTDAENLLWFTIRGRRFCGFKFRRQYPIAGYILDFYCNDAALAVELDGGGHAEHEQREYDEERTKVIEAAGIKVIRFWNNDVLNSFETVLEELHLQLLRRLSQSQSVPPHPACRPPSPSGRRD